MFPNHSSLDTSTTSAKFLNTSFTRELSVSTHLIDYFEKIPRLGSYSIIEVPLTARERVQIVVDRNIPLLQNMLNNFFKEEIKKLTIQDIEKFADFLKKTKISNQKITNILGISPHRNITKSKFLNVFYLEDIAHENSQRQLIFTLLIQILIEKYTKKESRLVLLNYTKGNKTFRDFAILLKANNSGQDIVLLDPNDRFPEIKNKNIKSPRGVVWENNQCIQYEVLFGELRIMHPKYGWNEKEKFFSIYNGFGSEILFQVVGRTTAEKRFIQEENEIERSNPENLVPIEIGFHPFWRRLGHTTLRIGKSLYELSSHGWRCHGGGADSARAYLFNNPYFKQQYELYKGVGMPPISIAANIMVTKEQALRLRQICDHLSNATGREKEKFSLFRNNCNQGIMRVLEIVQIPGFTSKGYLGFSSILSFQKLLVRPPLPLNACYIYPLPGSEISEENLRKWVPRLLYRHNTIFQEMSRALPSLAIDAIAFGWKRFSNFIFLKFRLKLWQGNHPYFMQ